MKYTIIVAATASEAGKSLPPPHIFSTCTDIYQLYVLLSYLCDMCSMY